MAQRKKIITVHKYVDWWLVEGIFLLLILIATRNVLHTATSEVSQGTIFVWTGYNILAILFVTIFVAIVAIVNERNEKRAFILALIALIFEQTSKFIRLNEVILLSDLSCFVLLIFAYYYLRKAGQFRRLNYIKTPFGGKGKKALIFSVMFLESIAIVLGIMMFIIWKRLLTPSGL